MVTITVHKTVNAPVSALWESWDDYANIADFHPGLSASRLLDGQQETGMGALRQCDFTDGKTFLKERITGYEKNKRMVLEIFDTNAPIRNAHAIFEFQAVGGERSRVTMTMIFTPKMGLLGRLLTPIMRKQFTKGLNDLLASNAAHVEQNCRRAEAA